MLEQKLRKLQVFWTPDMQFCFEFLRLLGHLVLLHSINANTLSADIRTTLEATYLECESLRHLETLKMLPRVQRSFLGKGYCNPIGSQWHGITMFERFSTSSTTRATSSLPITLLDGPSSDSLPSPSDVDGCRHYLTSSPLPL